MKIKYKNKTVIQCSEKASDYINNLPKIYLIGCWARCGIMECYWSGQCAEDGEPFVWEYYDGNGTCSEFHKMRISHITTGSVFGWNTDKAVAEKVAERIWEGMKVEQPWLS